MLAAYAASFSTDDPMSGLTVGERDAPDAPLGWEVVAVRAAALNRHDWWMLQGIAVVPVTPPVILGCDGSGVTAAGEDVVIYPVLGHGPSFHMLTDGVDGTLAQLVAVPSANLVPKPASLSFEEAAALPTAWLTAYSMLFRSGRLLPGERVLVQGANGGLATATIALAVAAGACVSVTSRSPDALQRAHALGAHELVESGAPLAEPVDVVIDSIGEATLPHSIRSLRFGGRLVVAGATSGAAGSVDVRRLFRDELHIVGHKMGSRADFVALCAFLEATRTRPVIAEVHDGLAATPTAMAAMVAGDRFGKIVVRVG